MNKSTTFAQFNPVCSSFIGVGGDTSATMKLGDLTTSGTTWDGSIVFFLNENGGTKRWTNPVTGTTNEKMKFYYYSADDEADPEDIGWYQEDDGESINKMDDYVTFSYGQGFIFDNHDDGATLNSNGQVPRGAKVSTVFAQFNMTGNCTPSDLTLGDFSTENTTWDGSIVFFLNENGGTKRWTNPVTGATNEKMKFYYYSADDEADPEDIGWYQEDDGESINKMNDQVTLLAGQALIFDNHDDGAKFVIPDVLEGVAD